MSVGLYMDVNIHNAITRALRTREVDVLTAQEDGQRHALIEYCSIGPLIYNESWLRMIVIF